MYTIQILNPKCSDVLNPPGTISTDHKFAITNYPEPSLCQHCFKYLNGLIHQGYCCSVCKVSVHRSCISSMGRCKDSVLITEDQLATKFHEHEFGEFYWFVGKMDRGMASSQLASRNIGTYLLRVSPHGAGNPNETIYALSLK